MASCTEMIMPLQRTVRAHAAPRRVYRSLADGITMPAERFFLYASARPRGCSCMCGRRRRHSEVGRGQSGYGGGCYEPKIRTALRVQQGYAYAVEFLNTRAEKGLLTSKCILNSKKSVIKL